MQHATTTSRPPGRCGPGEVSLIEVGRQAGSIVEGRFGAPPGDQLGPPSTVSETQRQRQRATKWAPPHARHVAVERRCRCVSTAAHLGTLDGNGTRCDMPMPDRWLAIAIAILLLRLASMSMALAITQPPWLHWKLLKNVCAAVRCANL